MSKGGGQVFWTDARNADLTARFAAGEKDRDIAVAVGTSRAAVQVQRSKLGLLRERPGTVADIRRRYLDEHRERRASAMAMPDDDDDWTDHLRDACAEMGRRIEATGRRFRDVVGRRAA